MTDAFPLQWPAHVMRTESQYRSWGSFQVTPETATKDLLEEIRRSGGTNPVISTNRPTRRDGLPMQSAREPDDPGVAVYFTRKGKSICIPCDNFDRVWKNIRAIGLSIKDMRGPESRGCAAITDQAFTGFMALPAPDAGEPWWIVLGVDRSATPDTIQAAYKALARANAGNDAAMQRINVARDQANAERAAA
jgi:hypothetical protein